ncbi:hypothetical protein ECH_0582 [Ehrlichia chaffeensis str. Arkansas]|uniref:Uncharacterized protein n=1 Tax=Ehrlichia chaffeensis (strain ATCC CRL-10679 / Arkansas) TaxID=205920 RepID=Q2GGP0_EHRCR|nr:hypothetical protein [Ehrlichia chaffeensis]ABD45060.1 hypothetical protein ECH_0582 [Ehrlichia chaffeensis str. Arkansas]AHX07156.1 hypothetical protein ECHOSC_0519 [Ehrlichia chaffeensis str. Osceola]
MRKDKQYTASFKQHKNCFLSCYIKESSTFYFPQSRITDYRINPTLYKEEFYEQQKQLSKLSIN